MKLVELLARELSEWPNGVVSIDQSVVDGELYGRKTIGGPPVWRKYLEGAAAKIETLGGRVSHPQWRVEREQVISQPQAEEVPMIAAGDTREYKGPFPCSPAGETVTDLEWDIQFQQGIFHMEAKTDQIDGPIKWRDQIVELEAHVEDIQREIASLFAKLNSEGFQLIRQYPSAQDLAPDIDMSDWRNWKKGDMIECVYSTCSGVYHVGGLYHVNGVCSTHADVQDDCGVGSSCNIADKDFEDVQFIRRP
jgi:hypothetical protein